MQTDGSGSTASLPGSKRYAENEAEWSILLNRQNVIITDLLTGSPDFLLVTGQHSSTDHTELHSLDDAASVRDISFITLDPIDLQVLSPDEFDHGQFFTPKFSEQSWQPGKFDELLKEMADDILRAFFLSAEKELIISPYDGGMDIILKDTETRDLYKRKYSAWLSARPDGL